MFKTQMNEFVLQNSEHVLARCYNIINNDFHSNVRTCIFLHGLTCRQWSPYYGVDVARNRGKFGQSVA
jgi:hypothetical protein